MVVMTLVPFLLVCGVARQALFSQAKGRLTAKEMDDARVIGGSRLVLN